MQVRKIFGHTEMQEFLAFSSPEIRFLVDSSSCSNKVLQTATKVEHLWDNFFSWKLFGGEAGHMEKQETERNRNWKWKLEMEIGKESGSKKTHQLLVQCFFIVCLSILLSNRYGTGFMSHALPLLLYCAL